MTPEKLPVGTRVLVTVKSHDGLGYYQDKVRSGEITKVTPAGYKIRIDNKNIIVVAKSENVRLEKK